MHAFALLLQNQPDPETSKHILAAMLAIIPIIILVQGNRISKHLQ
jgi:hypothetical protein